MIFGWYYPIPECLNKEITDQIYAVPCSKLLHKYAELCIKSGIVIKPLSRSSQSRHARSSGCVKVFRDRTELVVTLLQIPLSPVTYYVCHVLPTCV